MHFLRDGIEHGADFEAGFFCRHSEHFPDRYAFAGCADIGIAFGDDAWKKQLPEMFGNNL